MGIDLDLFDFSDATSENMSISSIFWSIEGSIRLRHAMPKSMSSKMVRPDWFDIRKKYEGHLSLAQTYGEVFVWTHQYLTRSTGGPGKILMSPNKNLPISLRQTQMTFIFFTDVKPVRADHF